MGGSANRYDYTKQDPINKLDLAGTISVDWHRGHIDLYIRHKDIVAAGTVAAVAVGAACAGLTVMTGVYGAICVANATILGVAVDAAMGYKNGNVKVTIQWWGQVKIRMRKK